MALTKEQMLEKAKLYDKYNKAITLLKKHKEDTLDELINNDFLEKYIYETIIVCKPDITNKVYRDITAKAKTILQKYIADIPSVADNFKIDDLRERNLAYEIKGYTTGYYLTIKSNSINIDEWSIYLKDNKNILKFIIMKLKED